VHLEIGAVRELANAGAGAGLGQHVFALRIDAMGAERIRDSAPTGARAAMAEHLPVDPLASTRVDSPRSVSPR
jgi:hypothetical protein